MQDTQEQDAGAPAETLEARRARVIEEQRAHVAALRAQLVAVESDADAAHEAIQQAVKQTMDALAAEVERRDALKAEAARLRQAIHEDALQVYAVDPDHRKQVCDGVGIRVGKQVKYDADKAFAWAQQRGLFVTKPTLDEKALDKFLLGDPGDVGLEYLILEVPKVTIASRKEG